MLRSMTGFGRAEVVTPLGRLVLEIQSLNRKYLDISIQLPKELSSFEIVIRNWLNKELFRGQVSVRYSLFLDSKQQILFPDIAFLKKLKSGWNKIAGELGLEQVDLPFLSLQLQKYPQPLEVKDQKSYEKLLLACTKKALDDLLKMKSQEGKMLATDIEKRLHFMAKKIDEIEKLAPGAVERLKKKLEEKILEAFPKQQDNEERILREVVIYAEKGDITEEIVRFRAHLTQFLSLLKKSEEAVGRKMEFIVQEMVREINTMGSKASDSEVSLHVVDVKSEIEKVREQIQNIE